MLKNKVHTIADNKLFIQTMTLLGVITYLTDRTGHEAKCYPRP